MTSVWEGAGIVSGIADVAAADDALSAGAAGLGLAVDALDFVSDPVGELASAGFGWFIEHVWFLREPLDALAGDPAAITAAAAGWTEAARLLRAEAADLGPVPGWTGTAATRYTEAEAWLADRLEEAAAQSVATADRIVASGVAVGTVRALVRDAIADFLAAALQWLVATLATSGIGLPVLVVTVVREALGLAGRAVLRLDELLEVMTAGAREVLAGSELVRDAVAHQGIRTAATTPEGLLRDAAVEWSKQASTAPLGAGATTSPDG